MRTFTLGLCLCVALTAVSAAPAVDRAAAADLSLAADTSAVGAPPFCHGIPCPRFFAPLASNIASHSCYRLPPPTPPPMRCDAMPVRVR